MTDMKHWEECSHAERIERWKNAARVLEELPEHERDKHWNMAWWGNQTACGTVACAAGHCALDPWFRERGLKMDFTQENGPGGTVQWYTEFDGDDVCSFFGGAGTGCIFFNGDKRSVEEVVREIKLYIRILKKDKEHMEGDPAELDEAFPGAAC